MVSQVPVLCEPAGSSSLHSMRLASYSSFAMMMLSRSLVPPMMLWGILNSWGHRNMATPPKTLLLHARLTWCMWRTRLASVGPASTHWALLEGHALGRPTVTACAVDVATILRVRWSPSPATARCSGAAMWSVNSVCRKRLFIAASNNVRCYQARKGEVYKWKVIMRQRQAQLPARHLILAPALSMLRIPDTRCTG